MPRDSDIATRVNRTAQDNTAAGVPLSVEAQPITEHNAIQGDKASQMADQLAESLGVANKEAGGIFAKQQAADTAKAQTDEAMGNTGPTNPSRAYAAARDHVHALASWAVDGDDLAKQAQQLGFNSNPDSKQGLADMNTWLNTQLQQRYAGSSKAAMATLAPKMAELRDGLNNWFTKDAAAQVDQKSQADLKTITGFSFAKAFTPTIDPTTGKPPVDKNGVELTGGMFDPTKFDYNGINQNIRALYPGGQGNVLMLSNLAEISKQHGTPSLLTNMPDRWADGTPTPKGSGDPKMVKMYEEAVTAAHAQQERNLTAADQDNKREQKEQFEGAAKNFLTQVAGGVKLSRASFDSQVGNLPGASYHDVMTLWEQNQSYGTKQEQLNLESLKTTEGLQDFGKKFNSIKTQVLLGSPGFQTLPEVLSQVHAAGYVGTAGDQMLSKLAPQVEAAGNNILKNPEDQGRLNQIKSVYNPGNYDSISKKFDNERNNAAREAALQAYHSARSAGTAPDAAMTAADAAATNAGKIYDQTQGKQGEQTRSAAQAYKDTAVTLIPTKVIREALQNGDTQTLRGFGLNSREIQRRMNSNELTPDEAVSLRNKIK